MNWNIFKRCAGFFRAEYFSPKDFVSRAVILSILFLVVHLAGLREHTSFLSGTVGGAGMHWRWSAFLGVIYLGSYFAFVLAVPIFLLAAGMLVGWKKWLRRGR